MSSLSFPIYIIIGKFLANLANLYISLVRTFLLSTFSTNYSYLKRKLKQLPRIVLCILHLCVIFQHLLTDFGLEVKWSGRSWVEVLLPSTMKNNTCGLCGPYNNNPADDWTVGPACSGTGTVVSNIYIICVQ